MKSNMYKMGNILIDNKSLYLTLSIATKLISLQYPTVLTETTRFTWKVSREVSELTIQEHSDKKEVK